MHMLHSFLISSLFDGVIPHVLMHANSLSSIIQTQILNDHDSLDNFSLFPTFDVPFPMLGIRSGGDIFMEFGGYIRTSLLF